MNCDVCRGACCEDLVFPVVGLSKLTRDFFRVRCGDPVPLTARQEGFVFPVRCPHHRADGLCDIYETRPEVCRIYEPGSEACIEAVKRRRTEEQFRLIRDTP